MYSQLAAYVLQQPSSVYQPFWDQSAYAITPLLKQMDVSQEAPAWARLSTWLDVRQKAQHREPGSVLTKRRHTDDAASMLNPKPKKGKRTDAKLLDEASSRHQVDSNLDADGEPDPAVSLSTPVNNSAINNPSTAGSMATPPLEQSVGFAGRSF